MTAPVDLYDAYGEHLRFCPLGALQALETVRNYFPSAARPWLSADQRTIWVRFPSSPKPYSYIVRPAEALQRGGAA